MTEQLEERVLCPWEHMAKERLPHAIDVQVADDDLIGGDEGLELIEQYLFEYYKKNKEAYSFCKNCPGYDRCYERADTNGKVNMFGLQNLE